MPSRPPEEPQAAHELLKEWGRSISTNGVAMMTASLVTPGLAPEPSLPQFKAAFLEPVLIAGAALFWVLALPVVAVSLMAVKIWEVLVALFMGQAVRPNPLILRHGPMRSIAARQIQKTAQV